MSKYENIIRTLDQNGECALKVFGQSMRPIINSGSVLTFKSDSLFQVGDVVLCKVKGRWIDAHKITKISSKGRYMIANNHGHENGWASKVFARVTAINGIPFGRE